MDHAIVTSEMLAIHIIVRHLQSQWLETTQKNIVLSKEIKK